MSKDRSKEILREIRSLREDLESRLDQLEAASGAKAPSGPSVQRTEVAAVPAARSGKPVVPSAVPASVPPASTPVHVEGPGGSPNAVTVVVRPLVDLGLARAVESSLSETDGIDEVRLSALSGDSAVIEASVMPGASVVNALRKGLPVAFDVVEAESNSVEIALARPEPAEPGPATEETRADT